MRIAAVGKRRPDNPTNENPMSNSQKILGFCLMAALLAMAGCAKYSDYAANMTYINDDLLNQEGELALEQLHEARAAYAQAVRTGPVAPGADVAKTFFAARDKYIVIIKEKERRKGRPISTKELESDPELVIPAPPGGGPRKATGSTPATPPETSDDAPEATAPEAAVAAPEKTAAADSPAAGKRPETTYTVQKGDTLGKIAKEFGVEVAALAAYNTLASRNTIAVGQLLKIPSR